MSVVLVVSRRATEGGIVSLLGALRLEIGRLGSAAEKEGEAPARAIAIASRDELERELRDADPNDLTVTYATDEAGALEAALERSIAAGGRQLLVVPLAVAVQEPAPPARLDELDRRVAAIRAGHPDGVEVVYVGPPWDDPPMLEAVIRLLGAGAEPGDTELVAELVARAFAGDWDRYAAFLATLRSALPADTRIVVRGSGVQGESYRSGEPFDARGPGTSDLDLVLLGDAAMALWRTDAFYLPNVNTMPLDDKARWVAPDLEPTRVAAQEIAGRPVAIQAMAPWFLELRSALQGTSFLVVDG
ncbi:MAG TPA: hypothetical protein VFS32_08100 [Candidatus Limnocylindrales bacterium]|nr:hypothetical protein [Candidatus Limnocylindrales bacterium]